MLLRAKVLMGVDLDASGERVGTVKDVYFDDGAWGVRYLVIDTGGWLSRHEVLMVPACLEASSMGAEALTTRLTRKQVEESPPLTADMPVSRQYEERLHTHYGWSPYWAMAPFPMAGMYMYPVATAPVVGDPSLPREAREMMDRLKDQGDPNLRSCDEVTGYHIKGLDGDVGHVEDFLIDTSDWRVTHLVVDTRNWLPGKHVVIDIGAIESIAWDDRAVTVRLSQDEIKASPEYDPNSAIDEAYQARLSAYYQTRGRSRYAAESRP